MSLNIAVNPCWFACNKQDRGKKPKKRRNYGENVFDNFLSLQNAVISNLGIHKKLTY
jgi:hypothetical protein